MFNWSIIHWLYHGGCIFLSCSDAIYIFFLDRRYGQWWYIVLFSFRHSIYLCNTRKYLKHLTKWTKRRKNGNKNYIHKCQVTHKDTIWQFSFLSYQKAKIAIPPPPLLWVQHLWCTATFFTVTSWQWLSWQCVLRVTGVMLGCF